MWTHEHSGPQTGSLDPALCDWLEFIICFTGWMLLLCLVTVSASLFLSVILKLENMIASTQCIENRDICYLSLAKYLSITRANGAVLHQNKHVITVYKHSHTPWPAPWPGRVRCKCPPPLWAERYLDASPCGGWPPRSGSCAPGIRIEMDFIAEWDQLNRGLKSNKQYYIALSGWRFEGCGCDGWYQKCAPLNIAKIEITSWVSGQMYPSKSLPNFEKIGKRIYGKECLFPSTAMLCDY